MARKYLPISIHQTLHGTLQVNWEQDYDSSLCCLECGSNQWRVERHKDALCKVRLQCVACRQRTCLTCSVRQDAFSIHQTLHGTLQVNWRQDYDNSLCCPNCKSRRFSVWSYSRVVCKVQLCCSACKKDIALTCPVQRYIFGYQPGKACPNPLCKQLGPDGKTKGWVFLASKHKCRCHFCGVSFCTESKRGNSWVGQQNTSTATQFCFEDDIWELQKFYSNPQRKTLNFSTIVPDWYRQEVKRYLYHLLKARIYRTTNSFPNIVVTLGQFGAIVKQHGLQYPEDISRDVVLAFIDSCKSDRTITLHHKLTHLRNFFDWLKLDSQQLVRSRDLPKVNKNDPNWLDETARAAIRQHLHKIPAPIARQYLVQEYTAIRPGDICQMPFDCLVEENGKWYVRFYQQKVGRWHQLPVSCELHKVIEEQQQWIRQTLGDGYPYLFCRFRGVVSSTYPNFSAMRPLPEPLSPHPVINKMVRIIRLLIENEDIRDANGQKPHFTGKITRPSRLQEIRLKHGIEAAQLYADHKNSTTTFQHYAPPTSEQVAKVDLPFQALLLNPNNRFLPWQSLPESLLQNSKAHELDMEINPRLVVYGHCALDPKVPCPYNLYPKCYGCSSFRPSTSKLPLYEQQYVGEKQRLESAKTAGAELAFEEAKSTVEAMDKWLPELRKLINE